MTFTPRRALILFLLCTTILSILNPTTMAAPVDKNDSNPDPVNRTKCPSIVSMNQGPSGINHNLNEPFNIPQRNEDMSEDIKRPHLEEIGGQGLNPKHISELHNVPDPGDNKSCTTEYLSSQRAQFVKYIRSQHGDKTRSLFVEEFESQFDMLASKDIPADKILERYTTEGMDRPQQQQVILSVPDPILNTPESISFLRAKCLEAFGLAYDAIYGVDTVAKCDVDMAALIQHHQQLQQPISSDPEFQIKGKIAHIVRLFFAGARVSPHSESESAMAVMIQRNVSEIHELILANIEAIELEQVLSELNSRFEDLKHSNWSWNMDTPHDDEW